jgi:hypothetical protein
MHAHLFSGLVNHTASSGPEWSQRIETQGVASDSAALPFSSASPNLSSLQLVPSQLLYTAISAGRLPPRGRQSFWPWLLLLTVVQWRSYPFKPFEKRRDLRFFYSSNGSCQLSWH